MDGIDGREADPGEWLVDPHALSFAGGTDDRPLGIVDLASWPREHQPFILPPYPLIGTGPADHPAAAALDAVIEAPVSLAPVVQTVTRMPHAAVIAVQLLRSIDGLPIEAALTIESLSYGLLQGSHEHACWLESRAAAALLPPGRLRMARAGEELTLVIDRPAARNAIDRSMRDALHAAFTVAALDPTVARIRLRASGPAFSVGADLAEFGTTRDPARAHAIRARTLPAWPLARRTGTFEVHVQGACIGAGLELAAFADRLTAAPNAWFQLPELGMGLIPGAGGCVSVSRRIGRQRAALMILSGRRIGARTALDWGLVDAIEDHPPVAPSGPDNDLA